MAFAGVSLIVDGKLCDSTSSPVDAGADSGYHLFVVQGYSCARELVDGDHVVSRRFIVGGHLWYLEFYPGVVDDEFLSVFLCLDQLEVEVVARVVFSFIDQPELRASMRNRQSQTFTRMDRYGFEQFAKREVLGRSRHMKHDSFTIRCDVVVRQGAGSIESQFGNLLRNKEAADIIFEVAGEKFAAHRLVLAAQSSVFKAQLFGTMDDGATKPSVIKINGTKADVFGRLRTFIYTSAMPDFKMLNGFDEEVEEAEAEAETARLLQLLEAAERYDLSSLKLICEETLACRYIRATTVADILGVAERTGSSWLKKECINFIKSETELPSLCTPDGLEKMIASCTPSSLKKLLSKFA